MATGEQVLTTKPNGTDAPPPPADDTTLDTPEAPNEPDEAVVAAEAEASSTGWVPEKDWKGDKAKWVPADEWLDRRSRVMPFVQRENFKLDKKLKEANATNQALQDRIAALEKRDSERETARGQIEKATLQSDLQRAYEGQDPAEIARATSALVDFTAKPVPHETPVANPQQQEQQFIKTLMENFVSENPVFSDEEMQNYLAEEVVVARTARPTAGPEAWLNRAKERVQRLYSERFQPVRQRAPMAETGGRPSRPSNGERTWADLNKESREALDGFIADSEHHKKLPLAEARKRILANAPDSAFVRK